MSYFQLAIFDLDGVLTETSEQHFQAWKVIADELNLRFDRKMNEQLKGVARMKSFEVILRENNVEDAYSKEQKVELITKKNEVYKEMISHMSPNNLFDGVLELFAFLKDKKTKIALASASHNGPSILERTGIANLFDLVVNPAEAKAGKPAPDIFLLAAHNLGIAPNACIGFEDAVVGIRAIKDADMYAVGIGDSGVLAQADVVFPHIKDFSYSYLER